ncbi:hypothetical protein A2Y85_07935 [candidate division WOR-3 bacterium RBG_13_43_14]|uniref:Secretion system C-terminal sorting domain-containing protein n=1 Tax=candidate division WOR-3 bacterium RBG_13_43_14 TaxID=1802590 RepID=A0A1F4U8U4_UNCW3|nr:MAG: hypothetical protein A2Y85_07935 [candidate division WOR-3 bacterium RBG_13_43_14]
MAMSIAIDPNNSNIVYVGGYPYLFKTINGGTSWINSTNGITDSIFKIRIDSTSTNIIYAASYDGVFKTTNSGLTWSNTGCTETKSVLIDPDDHLIIYAGSNSGVYKSTNGGSSWVAMNDGMTGNYISSLGINPGVYLYAGTEDEAMFRWSLQVGIDQQTKINTSRPVLSVYPNPAHNTILIKYQLSEETPIHLAVYDVTGRHIKTLVDAAQSSGNYVQTWDGTDHRNVSVAAGIYFYKLTTPTETNLSKIVLMK